MRKCRFENTLSPHVLWWWWEWGVSLGFKPGYSQQPEDILYSGLYGMEPIL